MKTNVKPEPRTKPIGEALTFFPIGAQTGRPLPDAAEKLAAFHARYPGSRRTLRKGEPSPLDLVKEARDRR